ncbi:MAG: DUF6049 family protein [Frankiaceae bacterium]|nr:DUF6049 family protein [Frankiaceae bacterium]
MIAPLGGQAPGRARSGAARWALAAGVAAALLLGAMGLMGTLGALGIPAAEAAGAVGAAGAAGPAAQPSPAPDGGPGRPPGAVPLSPPRAAPAADPVRVDLVGVSPMIPDAADLAQPVTITAVAVNTSGATYTGLRASLERGAPIVQPALLDDAVSAPPPTDQWPPRDEPQDQPGPLRPGERAAITFVTTPEQMCMCYTGVFPYDLVVEGDSGSGFAEVGRAAILIPSFLEAPTARATLSWVWPLIDQPHRIGGSSVFVDDELAVSVSDGGRLDRALQVVESTADAAALTVVVDPQLLDELLTMAGGYTVRAAGGDQPGSDAGAAAAWLARFAEVAPKVDIVLTPYGDPDPQTALAAGGSLSPQLPAGVEARIGPLVGPNVRTGIAWPDGAGLTSAVLGALGAAGASAVLMSGDAFADSPALPATAIAPAGAGGAAVMGGALDPPLQDRVAAAVSVEALRAPGASAAGIAPGAQTSATRIQALLGQLALWPIDGASGYVVLAPPPRVDPDPAAAAAAILATLAQPWSAGETLNAALGPQPRLSRGELRLAAPDAPSGDLIAAIASARQSMAAASGLLGDAAAATELGAGAEELVEAMSSAWRSDPGRGMRFAQLARDGADQIVGSVVIATPNKASYSLPSQNSPLILTLRNDLAYQVQVRLKVAPAPTSIAGFRADDVGVVDLPANGTRTLRVPAHFERTGRFQIQAQLTTVDGAALGAPVRLNVLCTAIGGVALAVTGAALALLVCILIFRVARGLRRRRAVTVSPMVTWGAMATQTTAPGTTRAPAPGATRAPAPGGGDGSAAS